MLTVSHTVCNSKRAAEIPEFAEFMTRLVYRSLKRRLLFCRAVLEIQRKKCKIFSTTDRYITFKGPKFPRLLQKIMCIRTGFN